MGVSICTTSMRPFYARGDRTDPDAVLACPDPSGGPPYQGIMQSSQTSPASPQPRSSPPSSPPASTAAPGCSGAAAARATRVPYGTPPRPRRPGFRPCLRCRPDREPDAGWIDAPELVCRALRRIADGALDDATEDELATRLGVSARHLRRLFAEHVGATPSEVARSRRAHFARRLLDDTDLPMTQIATAAGFNSVRQMNRVMKEVFRFTPQRAARPAPRSPTGSSPTAASSCACRTAPPLAWDALLAFLAPRAIPGVEAVDLDARRLPPHRRARRRAGRDRGVGRRRREQALRLRVHLADARRARAPRRAACGGCSTSTPTRRSIDRHLARDPRLRPLVRARRGLRVPGALDPFELGVRAILGQQVSVARATALAGRARRRATARRCRASTPLGLTHLFPSAATLARRRPRRARAHRRPGPDALAGVRAAVASGDLRSTGSPGLDDTVARAVRAPRHRAVDRATTSRCGRAGERDAFPAGDLGLRQALGADADPRARPRRWRPWRAYGAMHLWSALRRRRAAPGHALARARSRQARDQRLPWSAALIPA